MIWTDFKEAVLIGIILAFMVGPVFFMLIETSILKGFRAALVFDLGVMVADIIFVSLAYFGSKPLLDNIENNPLFLKIGGVVLMLYGLFSFFKTKQKDVIQDESLVIKQDSNYIKLFLKGFFLNLINVGALSFWIGLILIYGAQYQMNTKLIASFFGIIILSYLLVDILKILLAKKLRQQLTPSHVFKLKKAIAVILFIFGFILYFKNLIPEKHLKGIEKTIEKPVNHKQSQVYKTFNHSFS
ncbi:MAG: lysine transporter LysE [Flavobacteriia bacterium]|nr:MAG: lysine transporter LysE [Flavobacteriia bacterium]